MDSNLHAPENVKVWKRAKEDVPGTRNDQRPPSGGGEDTPRDEQVGYDHSTGNTTVYLSFSMELELIPVR